MPWKYEVDEKPKRKHHWDQPFADFLKVHGVLIGKCPSNLSFEEAEKLLNEGVAYPPDTSIGSAPARIYSVKDGVVYRATSTNPGVSYHGFPELGSELRRLPKSTLKAIIELAERKGCSAEVQKWIKR